MPTIYDALKSDHDKHRNLLAKLAATQGDSDQRRKLWQTFYYDAGAHAAAEELVFYSKLIAESDGQSLGRHSVAEHKELDDMIHELNEMEFGSPDWLARFEALKDRYEHHIEEEEDEVFPNAKDVIGADVRGAIGAAFTAGKTQERTLVDAKAENAIED